MKSQNLEERSLSENSLPAENKVAESPSFWRKAGKFAGIAKKRLKKWGVDSLALSIILTPQRVLNEMGIHRMDWHTCYRARLANLPLYLLAGPIMELRDGYRKKVWKITPDTSWLRDKASNLTFSFGLQLALYVPSLLAAGERDPWRIAGLVATNVGLSAALQTIITYPILNWTREKFGTTPEYEKKKATVTIHEPAKTQPKIKEIQPLLVREPITSSPGILAEFLNRYKYAPRVALASALGMFGLANYQINGLGTRAVIVEHMFEDHGQQMAVVRDDVRWARDRWYVQMFLKSADIKEGMRLECGDSRLKCSRIYNFRGESDSGEYISVNLQGYSVQKNKQAAKP